MDIATAAKYLKIGYRIRRACWELEEYVEECGDMLEKKEIHYSNVYNQETKKFEKHRYLSRWGGINPLGLSDLLAEDWEIITTGIRKQFNKYGNFEYDDEPDWDNYVCKGWGDEDDE